MELVRALPASTVLDVIGEERQKRGRSGRKSDLSSADYFADRPPDFAGYRADVVMWRWWPPITQPSLPNSFEERCIPQR